MNLTVHALALLTALSAASASEVLPGLRLDVYRAPGRTSAIEYDIVAAPGIDPARIALRFEGTVRIDDRGDLLVTRRDGSEERHSAPVSYQVRENGRAFVESRFRMRADGAVTFEIGDYDAARELVIDPVVTASRYVNNGIGGLGLDTAGNAWISPIPGNTIQKVSPLGVILATTVPYPEATTGFLHLTVDRSNNVYLAKQTPCPPGAFVIGSVPGDDIVVLKLNPDGLTRAYLLCIRPGPKNVLGDIAVDAAGNLYVAGTTTSNFFPATGNFGTLVNGLEHLFVFKVNAAGTNLTYSLVTGNEIDGPAIAIDSAGNAFVAGSTGPQFEPRQAFRSQFEGGSSDAFLLKILPDGTNIAFATFLGGIEAKGVAVDPFGNPIVAASRVSLPPAGPFGIASNGLNYYVGKFSADGQQLLLGTYVPGSADSGSNTSLAARGADVYLAGVVSGSNFPAINAIANAGGGQSDHFVVKLDAEFQRVLSTRFGGSGGDTGVTEIVAGPAGFVLTGLTFSSDVPARVNSLTGASDEMIAFVRESADLGIQVTRAGNQHRITVNNFGPDNATSVRISGTLPNATVTGSDFPCAVKPLLGNAIINCAIGTSFGQTARTITIAASAPTTGTFRVRSALEDPNPGNDEQ